MPPLTSQFMPAFAKVKPGMRVTVLIDPALSNGRQVTGRVVAKINAGQKLDILADDVEQDGTLPFTVPYTDVVAIVPLDPLDQVHPMLAKNLDDYKSLDLADLLVDPLWAMEEKFDGERQTLSFFPKASWDTHLPAAYKGVMTVNDEMIFRSATRVVGKNSGVLATNSFKLPHIATTPVPPNGPTVFDVELMHVDGFTRLRSIMGSDDQRALKLQAQYGEVYAVAFDVLWFDGIDMRGRSFSHRRQVLESWYEEADLYLAPQPLRTLAVHLSKLAATPDAKQAMLDEVLAAGKEGVMLKHTSGPYTDTTIVGQRSPDLLKVKPFKETDAIVVGFERGKGLHNQYKFGALHVAQWVPREDVTADMNKHELVASNMKVPVAVLTEVLRIGSPLEQMLSQASRDGHFANYALIYMGSTSGFTNEQEAQFRANPRAFIGKAVELKYQLRWPETGLLRHPNFLRMRTDKATDECLYLP